MKKSIEDFNNENKTKKNNALKAKDEKKQEEAFNNVIEDKMMDDLAGGVEFEEPVEVTGEDVGEKIKGILKNMIGEVSFNAWINPLEIRLDNDNIVLGCPNVFTKEIIEKRYVDTILKSIVLSELKGNIKLVVTQ